MMLKVDRCNGVITEDDNGEPYHKDTLEHIPYCMRKWRDSFQRVRSHLNIFTNIP